MADISSMMLLTCAIACVASAVAGLDRADLAGDFLGCPCCLTGERLDLGRDDFKSTSRIAGACRFDRGVQGQQIGLAGNGLDEIDDFTDAGCRLGEFGHGGAGPSRFGDGAGCDIGGLLCLIGNFADRRCEFVD